MPKYSVEWNPLFNDLKVRIPHLDKDWIELPPEMMSLWNASTGKSVISQYMLRKLTDKFIKERKLITAPDSVILDTEIANVTIAIPKRDLFVRAHLSNWFVEKYPDYKISDIASSYLDIIKSNSPDYEQNALTSEDIHRLFDVEYPLAFGRLNELCRAFNIKLFDTQGN